jgi:gamma-glutamyl phosphate reductase
MTPDKAELINRLRRQIADIQDDIGAFQEKDWELLQRGEDITAIYVQRLTLRARRLEELVEKHDPEGFTVLR